MRQSRVTAAWLLTLPVILAAAAPAWGQASSVRVKIDSEALKVTEPVSPVDPVTHIRYGFSPNMNFGFMVDGQRITYNINGTTGNTMVRIDGADHYYGNAPGQFTSRNQPLPPGPFGKKREGTSATWTVDKVHVTQVIEVVPSKVPPKAKPGAKRRRDTCVIRYLIENKDTRPHKVGVRNMIDMLIVNNDGALFASPTTHPKRILDGIELRGKAVPEYLQVLQVPNLENPGFVAHFTFKLGGRAVNPDRVVMTGLGAGGGWDVPAVMAGGDSAIAVYGSPREIKPGGKLEFAYAYGQGIASNPEDEGKVSLAFGGSFEPKKLFTVTAYVDAPVEGQSLVLDLPAGLELVEGKAVQPVPPPGERGTSIVLWKARVLKLGHFALRVRSSNGVTYTRNITVSSTEAGARASERN
jgi:hypothetical protein